MSEPGSGNPESKGWYNSWLQDQVNGHIVFSFLSRRLAAVYPVAVIAVAFYLWQWLGNGKLRADDLLNLLFLLGALLFLRTWTRPEQAASTYVILKLSVATISCVLIEAAVREMVSIVGVPPSREKTTILSYSAPCSCYNISYRRLEILEGYGSDQSVIIALFRARRGPTRSDSSYTC